MKALFASAALLAACTSYVWDDEFWRSSSADDDDMTLADESAENSTESSEAADGASSSSLTADTTAAAGADSTDGAATPAAPGAMTADQFSADAKRIIEVQAASAKVAAAKAKSNDVRALASRVEATHRGLLEEMNPGEQTADAADPSIDRLSMLPADEFDEAYLDSAEDAHKRAIALFRSFAATEASAGDDGRELRMLAGESLSKLETHLEDIQALRGPIAARD